MIPSATPLARLVVVLAAASAPALASAQEARDTLRLEEVTVTANRQPSEPRAVVASQTVITGRELRERGILFVHDALRDVAGVAVVQTGSYGAVTSLFLRGGESDYTKVLVDGVPVNRPGGSYDWAALSTDNIERIEVLRGPASVLYGADAMSGVVHVITRDGAGAPRLEGGAQGGTFGQYLVDGAARSGGERAAFSVSASGFGSDGFLPFNNAYRSTVATGRARLQADDRTDATVSLRYTDARAAFPTDGSGVAVDSNQYTTDRQFTLGVDVGRRLGARLDLRGVLTVNEGDFGFDNRPDSPGDTLGFGYDTQSSASVTRRGADVRLGWQPAPAVKVSVGALTEFERQRQQDRTLSDFGFGPSLEATTFEAERRTRAGYAQALLQPAPGLVLTVGGRVDDNSAFGTFWTARAGAAWEFATATRVRASVGNAFKAPTFAEQFANTAFEVGNPALRPERSVSWEVGVEQRGWDGRLVLGAAWFDQRFDDVIQYRYEAPGAPTYANLAGASARGLELTASLAPLPRLVLTGQYTRLLTEVTDTGAASSALVALGEPLLRRPGYTARVGGRYRLLDRVTVGSSVNVVGARDDADFSAFPAARVTLDAYALVDATVDAELVRPAGGRPGVAALLRVDNLFDAAYLSAVGFAGRGRTVVAGGRVRW